MQDVYKSSIDQLRVREVWYDEGFDLSSFPPVLNVSKSVFAVLRRNRCPFESLKHFPVTLPVLKKMIGSGKHVAADSIGLEPEQSPFSVNDIPNDHSCPKKQLGTMSINLIHINSAAEDLMRERKKDKASLVTIVNNYDISSRVLKDFPSHPTTLQIRPPHLLSLQLLDSAKDLNKQKAVNLFKLRKSSSIISRSKHPSTTYGQPYKNQS